MSISSNSWFSSVYQTWLGTPMSQDTWESFLTDQDVQQLAANDTADYHRLYLQKFIMNAFAQDPVVLALTKEIFPNASSDELSSETAALVNEFFDLPQVTSLPDSATKENYYALYWAFLFEMTLLNDPSTESWFQSTTEQFLGTAAGDNLPQIITTFLATPAVQSLPQSATIEDYQRLYVQYLSSSVNQTHLAEQVLGQSPEAIQQYKILWSVFELLSKMLDTMTISQIRNSIAVQFLAKKRSVGADAYDKVPTYVGNGTINRTIVADMATARHMDTNIFMPSSIDGVLTPINVDLTDPSKFNLGYDNISLQDITDWLYAQYQKDPTKQSSFSLYSGDYITGHKLNSISRYENTFSTNVLTLSVQTVDGKPSITANLVQYSVVQKINTLNQRSPQLNYNADGSINWGKELSLNAVSTVPLGSPVTISLASNDQSSVKDALNGAFTTLWQNEAAVITPTDPSVLTSYEKSFSSDTQAYLLAARTPKIPWSVGILAGRFNDDTGTPSTNQSLYFSTLTQNRASENELVSSQVTALTANMDVLKSLTTQQSQVQSTASSERQMTVGIMRSTIVTIQQILSALFA